MGVFEGGLKFFLLFGHIPVELFLLVTYFFDATQTSDRIFFKGQGNFPQLVTAFSFLKPSAHSRFLSLRQAIFVFSLKNLLCAVT